MVKDHKETIGHRLVPVTARRVVSNEVSTGVPNFTRMNHRVESYQKIVDVTDYWQYYICKKCEHTTRKQKSTEAFAKVTAKFVR